MGPCFGPSAIRRWVFAGLPDSPEGAQKVGYLGSVIHLSTLTPEPAGKGALSFMEPPLLRGNPIVAFDHIAVKHYRYIDVKST